MVIVSPQRTAINIHTVDLNNTDKVEELLKENSANRLLLLIYRSAIALLIIDLWVQVVLMPISQHTCVLYPNVNI